ncbi:MAG: glutamyl-tRNA amidotransferase [Bacteroides sp. SM23_62]|nr:MAG: glutamyl-tRNA amidotransferase [Bacteroides sp. SM23_62]
MFAGLVKKTNPYEAVIGLEVHAQLSTESKLFSSDPNWFGAEPNQNTSVISLGHPGSLPRINGKVVEYAIRLGLATHAEIAPFLSFARKHYFYTDLPKGYQISQHESPVCQGGQINIRTPAGLKKIRLIRIHIEEDAGKSLHDQQPDASLIDLNRAGVPLLEIVSEPDLRSGEEAQSYLGEIRRLVRYLNICDGNMEEGSLRCDANVSVRKKNETRLGTRTEIKNLNSMSNVRKAIEFEIERQIALLQKGGKVIQQTLSYDAQRNLTFPMRSKEEAEDYRYFPEPDLNPFVIDQKWVSEIRSGLPALPQERFLRYTADFHLPEQDADVLVESPDLSGYFEALAEQTGDPRTAANWMLGPVKSWLNEHHARMDDFPLSPGNLSSLITLAAGGKVSYTAAQQKIFPELIKRPDGDPLALARQMDLIQESGTQAIMKHVHAALDRYPEKIREYHNGKKGLVGLFMGEVMKSTGGKADPSLANKMIMQELDKRKQDE